MHTKIIKRPKNAVYKFVYTYIMFEILSVFVFLSVRWLEFIEETDKSCVEIPSEDSFPPALNEEVSLLHPLSPRGAVLSAVQVVLLTDSSEEQYASILTACGAAVTKIKGALFAPKSTSICILNM